MKITVGIPAYNEEKNIAPIIQKLNSIVDQIIVCNDGSSDNTGKIAERMGVVTINHERNMGYGEAIRSIFQKARELESDILLTMDSDGQHMIEDVLPVVDPIINNKSDIVIGSRFLEGNQENIPKYRKTGIKIITKLANVSLDEKITDSQSGFRAYSKDVLSKINPSEHGMGISNEILIKASKLGFKIAEVPITVSYEGDTSTQNPISHGASVTLSTLKFISIDHPLKFYGIPGVIFLTLGIFFTIWTLQLFSETREIVTNIALISVGCLVFGVMLIMSAIMLFSLVTVVREK